MVAAFPPAPSSSSSSSPSHRRNTSSISSTHHQRNGSHSQISQFNPDSSSYPPYPLRQASPSFSNGQLLLSPRQMLAAQQHFGANGLFGLQQQQQTQKQQSDGMEGFDSNSMWQADEYDSFLKGLMDGQSASALDHSANGIHDFNSEIDQAAMSSFSGSHSSYFSGTSDSGASPSSLHDFVYGSHNFPTPPESDFGNGSVLGARHVSMSMAQGISPASMGGQDDNSFAGPFMGSNLAAQQAMSQALTSFSMMAQPHFAGSSASSPKVMSGAAADNAVNSHFQVTNAAWDPNFLAPASAMGMGHPSQSGAIWQSRKRSATELGETTTKAARTPSTKVDSKAAASSTQAACHSKKLKSSSEQATSLLTSVVDSSAAKPASRMPHMEVGSNATALAAIERLKARRMREAEEAAEASRIAQAQGPSSSFYSATIKSEAEKTNLTPSMRQQKKVTHNAIERRYRNNINDRIAALRKAVPALRELRPRKTPSGRKSRKAQQEEDLVDGVPAATKLNKATILGKATDYIKYLKGRELRLAAEVTGLRELVRSLEGGEELLELWESEMEKVVAEQEAAAAAMAAALDEEDGLDMEAEDGDDDVDEDAEDDDDTNAGDSSRDSSSSLLFSRRASRTGGRGSKLGSLASSRYMLATFLGVTFIGGGAELAMDSSASDVSRAVSRPSTDRMVVGASRQLLKRSTTYIAPAAPITQEPHHFDHVPSHVLVFEIVRIVSFALCFLFLVWPILVRFLPGSRRSTEAQNRRTNEAVAARRKEMLTTLAKSTVAPTDIDGALRKFVNAPCSSLGAAAGILSEGSTLLVRRYVNGQRANTLAEDQEALAVWARLLEVETSLAKLAQPSLLLRIHTALKVANHQTLSTALPTFSNDQILSPARVHGTLAIAFAKLGDGYDFAQDVADAHWEKARRIVQTVKDEEPTISQPARWVETVLRLELEEALDLLSIPSTSSTYRLSPLTAIADTHYTRSLNAIWSTLFTSLIRSSGVNRELSTLLRLDLVTDDNKKSKQHAKITSLAATAPGGTSSWLLAQTTLAAWALVTGNLLVTSHIAKTLESLTASIASAASHSLLRLVSGNVSFPCPAPSDATDALAASTLGWIAFLRLYNAEKASPAVIESALQLRRLVHLARSPALEEEMDELVDTLSDVGRRAAKRAASPEIDDSGVEWE